MKSRDITKPSDRKLMEQIEANPQPGLSKNDQLSILMAIRDDEWSEPEPIDNVINEVREQIKKLKLAESEKKNGSRN